MTEMITSMHTSTLVHTAAKQRPPSSERSESGRLNHQPFPVYETVCYNVTYTQPLSRSLGHRASDGRGSPPYGPAAAGKRLLLINLAVRSAQ